MKLREYQIKAEKDIEIFLESEYKKGILVSPVGCHSKGYGILMYNGSIKKVEDIKIGDKLMGPDSKPRTVEKLYNGFQKFYKIILRNGISLKVNEDHILHLKRSGNFYKKLPWKNMSETLNISVKEFIKYPESKKTYYKLERKGYETGKKYKGILDLYYIGLYLGDGCKRTGAITTADIEIENYIYEFSKKLSCHINKNTKLGNKASTYDFHNKKGFKNPLLNNLREINILNNKNIPEFIYSLNSENRLELLAGLIDSDGYSDNGINYEITQKSKELSYNIYRLCGSLGLNPTLKLVSKKCTNCENKSKRDYYKVCFRMTYNPYIKLNRKKVSKKYTSNKNHNLYGFKLEELKDEEFFGFRLNGDNLYIDENFIIHHNSGKSIYPSIISKKVSGNTLVVQPSKELLQQNIDKARNLGLDPTIYSASFGKKDISKLTYATIGSITSKIEDFKNFENIIIDEAHLSLTNSLSNGKVSNKGKFSEFLDTINSKKIIGLTATPIQLTSNGFGSELKMMNRSMRSFWYKSSIFHITQIPDIKENYWANMIIDKCNLDINILQLNSTGKEFKEETIVKQYDANNLKKSVLESYYEYISKNIKSILTFVPSIEQAEELKKNNKDFEIVSAYTNPKEREAIINDFKKGNIPNIVNVNCLATGFDFPELGAIIMARETNSFAQYYQQIGRVVRPIIKNGNVIGKNALIKDLTGNTDRFGSIENITFENHDYTNGWGMWNDNRLLTGYPIGNWDMPNREYLIKQYESKIKVKQNKKANITDVLVTFGKYKDKSLRETFLKDPNYYHWLFNNVEHDVPWMKNIIKPLTELINNRILQNK